MPNNLQEHFESILKKVEYLESSIVSLKVSLKKLESEFLKPDYSKVEGESGKFNGFEIVTESGEKIPVPQNYAAKSRLVYGDVLKKIEEDGKTIFKQIQKVDRIQVEGILTKKEGEWYLLTDRGSYKVLDTAAEFLKAELNSEALAFLPANDLETPFATLDKLINTRYLVNSPPVQPTVTEKSNNSDKLDRTTKIQEKPASAPTVKKQPVLKDQNREIKKIHKPNVAKENQSDIKKTDKNKMFRGIENKKYPESKPGSSIETNQQQDTSKNTRLDDDDLV